MMASKSSGQPLPISIPTMAVGTASYAAAVTRKPHPVTRLQPVQLAHRPVQFHDKVPGLLLNEIEEDEINRSRDFTLIMKFSSTKPQVEEIRKHIAENWDLETQPAVGYFDPRHVTINMASIEDLNKALSRPTNKINNSMFRVFH